MKHKTPQKSWNTATRMFNYTYRIEKNSLQNDKH